MKKAIYVNINANTVQKVSKQLAELGNEHEFFENGYQ